jgi:hypothetical protein
MSKLALISHVVAEQRPANSTQTAVTCASTAEALTHLKSLAADSLDELYVSGLPVDEAALFETYRVLKPNAKLVIEHSIPTREAGQLVDSDLMIVGFVNSMVAKDPVSGERFAVGTKPDVALGAVAKVNVVQQATSAKWKMNTMDLLEDDLVDEDDLLDDGLDAAAVKGGCGDMEVAVGGKKRACKNCSCGLADEEANGTVSAAPKSTEEKIVKSSACGSCAKGDAFRCASCPFLGKPVFEQGQERVMLTTGVDDF